MNTRRLFQQHIAPTSLEPIALHITRAEGNYLYSGDTKYLDLIGGISVCNVGHSHPSITQSIKEQVDQYLHVMVYGELELSPQILYATALTEALGEGFDMVYFTNSGSEAIEAAMKLAKRYTGRSRILACHKSYHGSTQGALSILGDEYWRQAYRPLLPDIYHYDYNQQDLLDNISKEVAAVIIEPIQAEAGILRADPTWMHSLHQKCKETGTLLILDEVQTGFGRAGSLFAHTQYGISPDIIVLGKALGAGMPLGAISASRDILQTFSHSPVLGHITTFGGHPVSCAAGLAGLQVLQSTNIIEQALENSQRLQNINHPKIKKVNHAGMWAAIFFENTEVCLQVCKKLQERGIFTDWFLFAPEAIRISPPLSITADEIDFFIQKLYEVLDII